MTYKDLLDWAISTYPPKMYNTFNEWFGDVKQNFLLDNKEFPDEMHEVMQDAWIEGNFGKLGTPPEDTRKSKKAKTFNTIRELGIFRNKDVYDINPNRKQASVRRELQELVKEGRLERVSKGVYRIK